MQWLLLALQSPLLLLLLLPLPPRQRLA